MKCREVKEALVAYLDGEVMPSERTLIEAHLAGCESCERELSALASSRSQVAGSLKTMAGQAGPSPQAWTQLQASLAKEAPRAELAGHAKRKGGRSMKLRWRIALGSACALVLAAAVVAGVPSSRAAAGDFLANVFHIESSPVPTLAYLPAGFEPAATVGSGSIEVAADQTQTAVRQQDQFLYQNGHQFVLIKLSKGDKDPLPQGTAAEVNGHAAILASGLSGTIDLNAEPPGPDGAKVEATSGEATAACGEPGAPPVGGGEGPVTITGSGSAISVGGGDTGLSVSGDFSNAPSVQAGGTAPTLPPIGYTDGNSLTWMVGGTRVEILSNLTDAELQKIATGMTLAK
jgi:hypothetical protein